MKNGLGAPFVECWFGNIKIQDIIESFKYTYSEDDEDNCEINVRTNDRNALDLPQYQEGAKWTVLWGYIGGKKSHVRQVYCYEVRPEFDDQNVLITISFHEKAVTTKQRTSKEVHKNTSIVDILHKTGKVHGLKTSVEVEDSTGTSIPVLTSDELVTILKEGYKRINDQNALDKKLFGMSYADLLDGYFAGNIVDLDIEAKRNLLNNFNIYPQVAQGNKTDRQLLDELGKKQLGGQYILDSTDDSMVLRKRNFAQKPIRSYEFGGTDGELQAFQPESKGTAKNGTSVNMNYDGWDKLNKTYFNGDVDILDDNVKNSLAKFQKQKENLSKVPDNVILGSYGVRLEAGLKADATNLVQVIRVPFTALDKKTAIQKTLDYFANPDGVNKAINDPTHNNPTDAHANASNLRSEAELKNNPGYIEAWGDPEITKGKIITILGVSKKYSGNYYITQVDHMIDGNKPYMIRCDIVRQGHNIRTNPSYLPNSESGKALNKQVGTGTTENKTKRLTVKKNP